MSPPTQPSGANAALPGRAPAVFTIPSGVAFVDALAAGLLAESRGDPLALAGATVLLPTRRAVRALREAFLRLSGGRPTLLPRLRPLGDVDEEDLAFDPAAGAGWPAPEDLPPAIPGLRRQLLLTRLVLAGPRHGDITPDQAARLAGELARLLDQVHTERLDFAGLAALVPDAFADHWRITLDFLKILTEKWPLVLAAEGAIDPAERRNRLLEAQARAWAADPPAGPVVAAGSTGSIPATADLLAAVAALPRGRVVLPGLDRDLPAALWPALPPSHPQYGLGRLLARLGVAPAAVPDWPAATPQPVPPPAVSPPLDEGRQSQQGEREPGITVVSTAPTSRNSAASSPPSLRGRDRVGGDVATAPMSPSSPARAALINLALRPAEGLAAWQGAAVEPDATENVWRLDCPGPQEEALSVALVLRQALETPGRTAALVTPDRGLARRVAAEMRRWDLEVDDSAGTPLDQTPPGGFLRLCARLVGEAFAPVPLLAALKHPLAALGRPPGAFRAAVRRLEVAVLRGPRPGPGIEGLRQALSTRHAGVTALLDDLERAVAPFAGRLAGGPVLLPDVLRDHVAFAEALAAGPDQDGAARLWAGEAGEAAAGFVAELAESASDFDPVTPAAYPALLDTLGEGRVVRPAHGRHPRLHIWGPLEARLQHADVMVLSGLNEGTWPPETGANPWMSRPMQSAFGLPLPERRIGLAAHDFAQAFAAPAVVLTRAERVEGTPTVPSRWLLRLETLLGAGRLSAAGQGWRDWQRALDRPAAIRPRPAPEPRPPVAARPRRLSVTQVETWMRDPYAVYARHVLGLRALDPLDADPGAADYGTIVHDVLDRFLRDHAAGPVPADAAERLIDTGRQVFADHIGRPGVWAFWWPRFLRIAHWFVATEAERRSRIAATVTEARGELTVDAPAGSFTLTAVADRIDRLRDGTLAIIDYKTGAPPTQKEVTAGFAPQLPLEAAIAAAGGFKDVPAAPVAELDFWRLRGGDPAGEVRRAGDDPATLAEEALEGLVRLIAAFDFPETAYRARPHPEHAPRYSDYQHLARVKEWAAGGGDGE